MELSVREIVCINCGARHDRDDNAAKNIEKVGVGHTHDYNWTGRDVRPRFWLFLLSCQPI
ncbi:MAG TPA: hypothetical protein DCY88_08805 [Cyanobacteria bacterium UBA11372]|nr:hypothetical protein [Cyanobacteria bacterium UBA11372]